MKWCCISFKSQYEHAGQRGFAVLVGRDDNFGPYFLWQHRAVEPSEQQKAAELNSGFALELVSQTGLLFCPWCGKNLVKFYGRHARELQRQDIEIQLPVSNG